MPKPDEGGPQTKMVDLGVLRIAGSQSAPLLYIDGYQGAAAGEGIVRIRLVHWRMADDGSGYYEVVAHLVMSDNTLKGMHRELGALVSSLDGTSANQASQG